MVFCWMFFCWMFFVCFLHNFHLLESQLHDKPLLHFNIWIQFTFIHVVVYVCPNMFLLDLADESTLKIRLTCRNTRSKSSSTIHCSLLYLNVYHLLVCLTYQHSPVFCPLSQPLVVGCVYVCASWGWYLSCIVVVYCPTDHCQSRHQSGYLWNKHVTTTLRTLWLGLRIVNCQHHNIITVHILLIQVIWEMRFELHEDEIRWRQQVMKYLVTTLVT